MILTYDYEQKIRVLEEKLKLFEAARDSLQYKTQHIEGTVIITQSLLMQASWPAC